MLLVAPTTFKLVKMNRISDIEGFQSCFLSKLFLSLQKFSDTGAAFYPSNPVVSVTVFLMLHHRQRDLSDGQRRLMT